MPYQKIRNHGTEGQRITNSHFRRRWLHVSFSFLWYDSTCKGLPVGDVNRISQRVLSHNFLQFQYCGWLYHDNRYCTVLGSPIWYLGIPSNHNVYCCWGTKSEDITYKQSKGNSWIVPQHSRSGLNDMLVGGNRGIEDSLLLWATSADHSNLLSIYGQQ